MSKHLEWWSTCVLTALKKLRQEDDEFAVTVGYKETIFKTLVWGEGSISNVQVSFPEFICPPCTKHAGHSNVCLASQCRGKQEDTGGL